MSTLATQLPAPAGRADDLSREPSRHLWGALSRANDRGELSQGADLFGEWVIGWRRRRVQRRLDWKRAESIMAAARRLAEAGSREFGESARAVGEQVRIAHRERATVDLAFATAYEAVRRSTGLSLHPVQVLAALAMSEGCCAELATGEGKTVTAILPAALQAWRGRGVHVVTVNDYLASRDAATTRDAYSLLGLSVGLVQDGDDPDARRRAYRADVTYASDKQVIFDHLRDRLLAPIEPRLAGLILDELFASRTDGNFGSAGADWGKRVVQRGLAAAIVDEADSVLIDEAVTPAIISSARSESAPDQPHIRIAASLAAALTPDRDFTTQAKNRRVQLTPAGRERLGELAAQHPERLPEFWAGPRRREELVQIALAAREFHKHGDDYIIQDGKILIVDRSTGRILRGRQWHLGLHQAVEAKEGLELTAETETTARSSYQRFYRRYTFLAGMTGTAREVAAEMWRWYRLVVAPVPTHRPIRRARLADRFLTTEAAKLAATVARVSELHRTGRPVLVGTRSVTASEALADALRGRGLEVAVLNANREAEEAAIVARAGGLGAITVATNMAGRGTDIILDEESRAAGGLAVVATERHDEARVDRQLFGRAGRQGDPGSAEAIVSLEDPLVLEHGPRLLRWIAANTSGPLRDACASLLWRVAQRLGSRKWAVVRSETAKADAQLELSLNQPSR